MRPRFFSKCYKSPDLNMRYTSVAKLSDDVFVINRVQDFIEPDYIVIRTDQF